MKRKLPALLFAVASLLLSGCDIETPVLPIIFFEMNTSEKDMALDGEYQLSVNVLPTAYASEVTWSSNNTNIATVSSTGLVSAKAVGNAVITATSSDKQFTTTCDIHVKDIDSWTLLIYICGSDLESDRRQGGLASEDINEMLKVEGQPNDINVVIQTGGAKRWQTSYGDKSKTLRWHIENKQLKKDQTLDKKNMGDADTLESFLTWGISTYPAEKIGLIMWNHGGGLDGCCYDENYSDDALTSDEVEEALENTFKTLNRTEKLEFIGYDCCLMQVQDVAEINAKYFNYMIASQESEVGQGWSYDTWFDDFYLKKDTETLLATIVDSFIVYTDKIAKEERYDNDQTLSFLDLSKINEYKNAFEALAVALQAKVTSSTKSAFKNLMGKVKNFAYDGQESNLYYGLFDVKDFLTKLKSNSTFNPGGSYIANVEAAFNNLVKYSKVGKGAGESYGLSLCWGISSDATTLYRNSKTNFKTWQSLSNSFGA